MGSFPTRSEAIGADWLTGVLHRDGVLPEGRVVEVDVVPVGEPGQTSEVVRLSLAYRDAPPSAPTSLVAKFAARFEEARAQVQAVGGYACEVRFYQDLGDDAGIAVPHAYAAEIEDSGPDFVLLTEDLGAGRNGDLFVGSLADAELALDALPPFHARWWQDPSLRRRAWVRQFDDSAYYGMLGQLLQAFVPAVEQKYPEHFRGYLRAAARRLAEGWDAFWPMEAGSQWTLVHSDYHPKQIFFPSESGGRFAVFDWQTAGLAPGAMDVHRIMLFGLSRRQLADHQQRLLERYHRALVAAGVDYPIERLIRDYRRSLLITLFISVFALATTDIDIMQKAAEVRGVDLYQRVFDDLAAALELNRVLDLLD